MCNKKITEMEIIAKKLYHLSYVLKTFCNTKDNQDIEEIQNIIPLTDYIADNSDQLYSNFITFYDD